MKNYCSKCRSELIEGFKFCSYCGEKIGESSMIKAGASTRFGSYVIDLIILGGIGFITGLFFALGETLVFQSEIGDFGVFLISGFINLSYYTYFFGRGQTPGMKSMKIKLLKTDGTQNIGYFKGFLRWVGMLISALAIYLGFLWIFIDENSQGWHDKIADTIVVLD